MKEEWQWTTIKWLH